MCSLIWDIIDRTVASIGVSIPTMYEHNRSARSDEIKERWIPNTGEYLIIKPEISLKNSAGVTIDVNLVPGSGMELVPSGAQDRNYYANKLEATYGNIYNNSSTSAFELAIVNEHTGESWKLGTLTKSSGVYWLKTNDSDVYEASTQNKVGKLKNSTNGIFLKDTGELNCSMNGTQNLSLGIRPLSASVAKAGDDLLLGFIVRTAGESDAVISVVYVSDSDYIAVYDKKLLWRANLYIDEGDGDWNNAHPWNAPADSSAESAMTTGKTLPEWWNKDWGYNEWNRKYNLNQNSSDSISKLAVGNGGQVVKFSGYTSLRSEKGDEATMDSVCYDYNNGTVNAWDSPFDFIWKMNKQKEAMASHFKTKTATAEESKKTGEFPETKTTTIEGNEVTNKTLSDWPHTHAPNSRWKFYWKESENGSSPYIPGLGFWKEKGSVTCTGENQSTLDAISFPSGLSSGTDCIGFAERAANYKDNPYKWTAASVMPSDRAEGNDDPDDVSRTANPLSYPLQCETGSAYEIVTWKDVNNSSDLRYLEYYTTDPSSSTGPSSEELERIKSLFLQVKPGDVITYAHETAAKGTDSGKRSGGHIGIVNRTDYNTISSAKTIHGVFSGIEVIECVFNQKLFNVFTRRMTEGPINGLKELEDKEDKINSWYINTLADLDDLTSCYRRWSIQRLGGK